MAKEATRDGFGRGLVKAAQIDVRIVALCADLAESTRLEDFKKVFPDRYVELGVAEQNLAAVASGFAAAGKRPVIASYAAFSPGRNNEQIRTTIAINEVPVVIAGMHAGVSVGPDGATHQALEDIALMRVIPNMTVVVPADSLEAEKATIAAFALGKPIYLRFGRSGTEAVTTTDTPFEIGKAHLLKDSQEADILIVGCGAVLAHALEAANTLAQEGLSVRVLNMHTVKPLDTETLIREAKRVRGIVTVEEHQIAGGLGSAVAEVLAEEYPLPVEFVGVRNRFGQSGTPEELYREYGIDAASVVSAVKRVFERSR
jgi:transketolase